MDNLTDKTILQNCKIKTKRRKQLLTNSQIEYHSYGSDVDEVHTSNDPPSLLKFGVNISPVAKVDFNERITKSSSGTEKTNSERKLPTDSTENSSDSTVYERILPLSSNYDAQSSIDSKQFIRKSPMKIARSYHPRMPSSCCCCCCCCIRCRCCCCRWNSFRFESDSLAQLNFDQIFPCQNKRKSSRSKKRTKSNDDKED